MVTLEDDLRDMRGIAYEPGKKKSMRERELRQRGTRRLGGSEQE